MLFPSILRRPFYLFEGYYKEALDEFEYSLEIRKKLTFSIDLASSHRFIAETLCKLGTDFDRAKEELDLYHSITIKLNDLVENQRALTTLGNYFMTLATSNTKGNKQFS